MRVSRLLPSFIIQDMEVKHTLVTLHGPFVPVLIPSEVDEAIA